MVTATQSAVQGASTPCLAGLRSYRTAAAALAVVASFASGVAAADTEQAIIKSHGISTFGDLKYPAGFAHLDYVYPDAPKGGEFSTWSQGTFDSMNPYSRKGRAGTLSNIFYESLLAGTADEVSASYGLLAESLEYPADRSWVVFNLRPEARFSDGTPVTADDILFTYEIFLEEGLISFRRELAKVVKSVEIENPHRIKFVFNTEESTRDYPATIGGLPIFSKAWFEKSGASLDESRLEPAVGSGEYILDSLEVNTRLVYRRNPDYWGSHLPINQGRSNFDTIRIEYFADTVAALEGFKAGAYTFRVENLSKSWATAYDFPAVEKGWVLKRTYLDGTSASGQSFAFNLRHDKFKDRRIREALGMMFNFDWSNATLFYGLYARIHSFWENSELAATGLPGPEELALLDPLRGKVPDEVFTEPAQMAPPASGDRQLDRGNLRAASKLLDEAGWITGDDGLRRNADGETLRVEFLERSPSFDRIVNPYVDNLRRLGVDAIYNRVDPAQYTDRARSHDFDVITTSFPMSLEPGIGLRQYFGSESIDGVFNDPGFGSEAVDELINHVLAATSTEELHIAVRALDRVLRAEKFWVPQWFKNAHTVAYYDFYEHPDEIPPFSLGQIDFWWFNAEKAEDLKNQGAF